MLIFFPLLFWGHSNPFPHRNLLEEVHRRQDLGPEAGARRGRLRGELRGAVHGRDESCAGEVEGYEG